MVVREILHAHIPVLRADATVRDAVDRMDVYQFPALVVVDEAMAPTHVITEGDISRAISHGENLITLSHQKAVSFASSEPVCTSPDKEIGDALHLMLSRGITLLPVVEDNVLIGVVLRVDLMQAMLMDVVPKA